MASLEPAEGVGSCGCRTPAATPSEDERREHVDEERVPTLALEPAERGAEESGSSRSRIAAIAMKMVGKRTRNPQKMKACMTPGPRRWRSFLCPRTTPSRCRCGPGRSTACRQASPSGRAGRGRGPGARTGSPRSPPPRRARARRRRSPSSSAAARLPKLGRDRGNDLVQVADHGVVGAREDRRFWIRVDGEDRLRALASGHVLGRARRCRMRCRCPARSSSRSARPDPCAAASPPW